MSVILFSLFPYLDLGEVIRKKTKLRKGDIKVIRFPNQEVGIELGINVAKKNCYIIGTTAPPDANLLTLLMAAHTLKNDGAKSVTAILPYAAYARADKKNPGRSLGAACIGKVLKSAGVDRIISVDVHSSRLKDLYPMPLKSISIVPLFTNEIKRIKGDVTIVAPDEGSLERCRAVQKAAGISTPVAFFKKTRQGQKVTHSQIYGEIKGTAIVVDDILDTGRTLVSSCKKLKQAGAKEIIVMVTHGLFNGSVWQKLWGQGVTRIYCTDTVGLTHKNKKIIQLSAASLLAKELIKHFPRA